jgi:hypothetical protein
MAAWLATASTMHGSRIFGRLLFDRFLARIPHTPEIARTPEIAAWFLEPRLKVPAFFAETLDALKTRLFAQGLQQMREGRSSPLL